MCCNDCTYCKYFKYSYTEFGTTYIYCKKKHDGMFPINFRADAPFVCGMIKLSKWGKERLRQLTPQYEDKGDKGVGKFKNAEELEKAHKELEKEFTRTWRIKAKNRGCQ